MLGHEFIKLLRLLKGRSEIIRTRFELDENDGRLVEHVTVETYDDLPTDLKVATAGAPRS
jgi:hypothetical protein